MDFSCVFTLCILESFCSGCRYIPTDWFIPFSDQFITDINPISINCHYCIFMVKIPLTCLFIIYSIITVYGWYNYLFCLVFLLVSFVLFFFFFFVFFYKNAPQPCHVRCNILGCDDTNNNVSICCCVVNGN